MSPVIACLLSVAFVTVLPMAFADQEAPNYTVVRSSTYGRYYVRSVPVSGYGQEGKTQLFRVEKDGDKLVEEYDWYAMQIHIGGEGDRTLVRLGPWQRGHETQAEHLAIGLYRNGKILKEYSTEELERKGSGIESSKSHYEIFRKHLGFRSEPSRNLTEIISRQTGDLSEIAVTELARWRYVYRVETVSGRVFSFDLETGDLSIEPVEPDNNGDSNNRRRQPQDSEKKQAEIQ